MATLKLTDTQKTIISQLSFTHRASILRRSHMFDLTDEQLMKVVDEIRVQNRMLNKEDVNKLLTSTSTIRYFGIVFHADKAPTLTAPCPSYGHAIEQRKIILKAIKKEQKRLEQNSPTSNTTES